MKNQVTFYPIAKLVSVVEQIDDIELMHGFLFGDCNIGTKFSTPSGTTFRVIGISMSPGHTAYVERVEK